MLILCYFALLCFIAFNVYRIMIKMRMLTVVPLTIFYVCSTIIVLTRIINDSVYFHYYRAGLGN